MGLDNFFHGRISEEDTFQFTLVDVLRARAERTPDETAYIFLRDGEDDEECITYAELDRAAKQFAQRLSGLDARGERALMLFPPGLEFVKALFGCFYAGVIAVPAYPPRKNRSLERLRTLVADSGATIVMSTKEIHDTFERSFHDLTELDSLTWFTTPLSVTSESNPARSPRPIAQSSNRAIVQSCNPTDLALLQYTSGSTGQPKGVMVTHRNIMRNVEFIRQSFSLSQKSVSVTWLPSFHDMGLIDGVIEPVYTGFPGVIIPPVSFLQKPVRWLRAITKYRGTHCGGPNFGFDLCVDGIPETERTGLDLSSLNTLYCGAEPIRKSTFEQFVEVYRDHGFNPRALYPCFGMAETTLITTGPHAGRGPVYLSLSGKELEKNKIVLAYENEADARHLVGVGYPWLDTVVKIVDPEKRTRLDDDMVGEIWVSGSVVTAGYWNKTDETKETFLATIRDEEGTHYLRTGDLGFFHEGELYISGRSKDLIIIRGRNIYPQDVEFITENSHPSIRPNATAAFSIDVNETEKLVIIAELERTALRDIDTDTVCDAIRQRISEEMELAVYAIQLIRTASILKTSSGKIQRKACKEAFLHKSFDVIGESILEEESFHHSRVTEKHVELVTLQAWLVVWIHQWLKIPLEYIDPSKPITSFGLNSIKAVQLQQDFLERFGVNFPPYLFFEKISIGELCLRALDLIQKK